MKKIILTWLLIFTSLTTFSADKPISGLTVFNGAPGTNDLIPFVNRADVTQSTNGSTRSMTWSNLNYSLRTSYPAMTLTNIGLTGSNVNVTNIIGYNGSTFYGSGAVVDNWVFYGNNTFTGDTNRFASTVLLTNMNNTVSGNGAGLTNINLLNNGIGLRLLYSSPTNYTVSSSVVSATPLTNNGDYASGTPLWTATIPPLLSSNSGIMFHVILDKPNALGSSLFTGLYIGTNTNFFYYNSIGSAAGRGGFTVPSLVLENDASFTNQVNFNSTAVILATNFCNTSTSNTVYFNCWTTSASTNFTIKGYALYELVK